MSAADLMASRVRVQELEGRVSELTDVVRMLAAVVHGLACAADMAGPDEARLTHDAETALKAAWAVGS